MVSWQRLKKKKKKKVEKARESIYFNIIYFQSVFLLSLPQATTKTLAQQQEQLKKMETFSALQETNKMLKMDREKLEQELKQAQARVSLVHALILFLSVITTVFCQYDWSHCKAL